ncbi:MAG: TadE/TadG family type IV pilus assembly protein [Shimia sp.]
MIRALLSRFRGDDHGTTTFDFIIVFPAFLMVFMASFESGMLMARSVMMDRSMEITTRAIRLRAGATPDYEDLRHMICVNAVILRDCDTDMKLEMIRIDPRDRFRVPARADCVDRRQKVQPVRRFDNAGEQTLMVLRACMKFKTFFPAASLGAAITDKWGEYGLVSTSVYVSEPA